MTRPPAAALDARLAAYRDRIETVLDVVLTLPDPGTPRLRAAMRYSSLSGGKRLRPILVYLTGSALGAPLEQLDAPAAAVELIHVYSLVHDDLPAMDNDDLRRGRPTCHRAFDEATAILTGDALQALAFQVLAGERDPAAGDAAACLAGCTDDENRWVFHGLSPWLRFRYPGDRRHDGARY